VPAVEALPLRQEVIGPPLEPVQSMWASLYRRYFNVMWGTVSVVLFLVVWEVAIRQRWIDPFFLSSPTRVWDAARGYVGSREFFNDLGISGAEFLLGFGLSVLIGIPLGIAIGWSRLAHSLLNPLLFAFYVVPHVALLPLVVMWFGIGVEAKALFITMSGVFPILYNTAAAISTVDPRLVAAARSFKATDMQILMTVAVPGAVPVILSGVRLAVGKCLTALVVAEFWAAFAGLGNLISRSASFYLIGKMFVGVVIIAILGITLTEIARLVEDRFDRWRVSQGATR
jgi:ABC-type nitrate/sulfonate/bicarbonate transport system permease component